MVVLYSPNEYKKWLSMPFSTAKKSKCKQFNVKKGERCTDIEEAMILKLQKFW
jgi:hypothetical protein